MRLPVYVELRGIPVSGASTVRDVFGLEADGAKGVPALVLTPQTQGDFLNWHPHVHGVVAEGVFSPSGEFVHIPDIQKH